MRTTLTLSQAVRIPNTLYLVRYGCKAATIVLHTDQTIQTAAGQLSTPPPQQREVNRLLQHAVIHVIPSAAHVRDRSSAAHVFAIWVHSNQGHRISGRKSPAGRAAELSAALSGETENHQVGETRGQKFSTRRSTYTRQLGPTPPEHHPPVLL
jgi:hypothetical protein